MPEDRQSRISVLVVDDKELFREGLVSLLSRRPEIAIVGQAEDGFQALEMARQLQAEGQRVSLLALFNSMPPNSSYFQARWSPGLALRFIQNSWNWLGYFRQWRPEQRRDFFRS